MAKLSGGSRMILPGIPVKTAIKPSEASDLTIGHSSIHSNEALDINNFKSSETVKDLIAQPTVKPSGTLHQKLAGLNFNPAAMLPGAKPVLKETPAAPLEHATMGRATMKRKGRKNPSNSNIPEEAEVTKGLREVITESVENKSDLKSSVSESYTQVSKPEIISEVKSIIDEPVERPNNIISNSSKKSLFDDEPVTKPIVKKSLFDDDDDPFMAKVVSKPSENLTQSIKEDKVSNDALKEINTVVKEVTTDFKEPIIEIK